jgi:O-antigen ligase
MLPFLFFTFILAPDPEKWVRNHAIALGIASLGLSCWALIQFFFLFEQYGPRIHHPMLNPNSLAVMFNMTILPAAALFLLARRKDYVILSYILFLIVCSSLLATMSRGAIVALLMTLPPFFILTRKVKGVSWKKTAILLASAIALYFLLDLNGNVSFEKNFADLGPSRVAKSSSVVDRVLLWKSTWEIIKDHFWLGTGLGTFYYYYPAVRNPKDMSDGFFSHMDPLQFWQEMGILAPVLFYSVLLAVLIRTIIAIRALPKDSTLRLEIMAPFCALLALALHTHLTFHLYILITQIPAGLLLAYWFVATERALGANRKKVQLKSKIDNGVAAGAFSLVYTLAVIWMIQAALGIHYISKANVLLQTNRLDEGYKYIKHARTVAPDSYQRPFEYEAKYRLTLLWQRGNKMSYERKRELFDEALKYIDLAIERNPAFTHLWNYKALLFYTGYPSMDPQGRDKAIELLKKTIKANPMMIDARMGLSRIYKDMGNIDMALRVLEGGLGRMMPKSPSTINFFYEIANLRRARGDIAGYRSMIEAAQSFAGRYGLKR